MSNIIKWSAAIQNEDGNKLSLGSLRTLKLMEEQYTRMRRLNDSLENSLQKIHKFASDCGLDNINQMSEAIKWIMEEVEAAHT